MTKEVLLFLPAPLFAYAEAYDPPANTMLILGTYMSDKGINVALRSQSVPSNRSGDRCQHYPGTTDLKEYLQLTEKVLNEHPEATHLAISCWQSFLYVSTLLTALVARQIRPDLPIIVGGYHPTAVPWEFQLTLGQMENLSRRIWFYNVEAPTAEFEELEKLALFNPDQPVFDYIIRGPGESALNNIIVQNNGLRKTSNTMWGEIPSHGPRYNWDLLEGSEFTSLYPFVMHNNGEPTGQSRVRTLLSRGCAYHCRFCLDRGARAYKWRAMSPKEAVEHIQDIENRFNPTTIAFSDPSFGMLRSWRRLFLQELNNTPTSSRLWTDPRIDLTSREDYASYAKKFFALSFAVESGSPQQLLIINKTRNPNRFLEHFLDIVKWNNEFQLKLQITLIFAFPGETFQTAIENVEYWKKILKIDAENDVTSTMGYFGTYYHWPGSWIWNNESFFTENLGTGFLDPVWWNILFTADTIVPWWLEAINPTPKFTWLHGQMARAKMNGGINNYVGLNIDAETRLQMAEDFIRTWKDGQVELREDWLTEFNELWRERQNWLASSVVAQRVIC
ncbi:MAG: B12-binding domain-containing radical SAM protein [Candidatus Hodarchaeota archaeon]